jgi:hypothetical protein
MNLTQEQMISVFLENQQEIKKYNKQGSVLARKALTGEEIVTKINGIVETKNTAKENDVLLKGVKGEEYLMSDSKFEARYNVDKELSNQFQEYKATGSCFAYQYKGISMEFIAAWGELMRVEPGDYLAAPDSTYSEVYRIEKDAFIQTYK